MDAIAVLAIASCLKGFAVSTIPQALGGRVVHTYRAFISYSHADAAMAHWLHTKLETYRLPRGVGDVAGHGTHKGRLGPIFRDREELAAAQDLSSSVQQALAASDVLIVLCSPDAAKSHWVAQEIELFRAVNPDRPILAAIVGGEPEQAFPPALLKGGEPLAADLRRDGDGQKLGFLKIVAGLADVPLDALVQRDSSRKLRRVMVVTLVAALAAIVMAIMTFIALQSRNEAEHQRAEAEGLVEYMLTDLRKDLIGVGRLDVRNAVNGRAMAYYEAQGDLEGWPAESLDRRARVLQVMGEDETYSDDRDLEKALEMFREAERTTAALRSQDPVNPDRIFGHAQSQYWMGRVGELHKDFDTAAQWYGAYQQSVLALSELEPNSSRTLEELGHTETNLGIIALERPEPSLEQAELHFEAAIDWFSKTKGSTAGNSTQNSNLANAWSWLANMHFDAGNFAEAMPAWQESAALKLALAADDPADLDARYSLLIAQRGQAVTLLELGRAEEALSRLRELVPKTAALSAIDPKNAEWEKLAKKTEQDVHKLDEDKI